MSNDSLNVITECIERTAAILRQDKTKGLFSHDYVMLVAKAEAAIAAMGDASTRKDEVGATTPEYTSPATTNNYGVWGQPSEISVNEEELMNELADYLEGFEKLSKHECKIWSSKIMTYVLRPYFTTREPMSRCDCKCNLHGLKGTAG